MDARGPAAQPVDLQDDLADRHGSSWGRRPRARGRPSSGSGSARSTSAIGRVPTSDAVAQGRHAVGDLGQLLQPVRDVDDPDALRLQLADRRGRGCSTSWSLSEAVGSSMIRIRASAPSARAISTSCCSGIERRRTSVSGSIAAPIRSSSRRARSRRSPQRMRRQAPARLQARGRCSRRRSGRGRGPAAGRSRRSPAPRARTGSFSSTDLAVDLDRPLVRPVGAGDDLDQRRLPRAVLADQRVDLARPAGRTRPP